MFCFMHIIVKVIIVNGTHLVVNHAGTVISQMVVKPEQQNSNASIEAYPKCHNMIYVCGNPYCNKTLIVIITISVIVVITKKLLQ